MTIPAHIQAAIDDPKNAVKVTITLSRRDLGIILAGAMTASKFLGTDNDGGKMLEGSIISMAEAIDVAKTGNQ